MNFFRLDIIDSPKGQIKAFFLFMTFSHILSILYTTDLYYFLLLEFKLLMFSVFVALTLCYRDSLLVRLYCSAVVTIICFTIWLLTIFMLPPISPPRVDMGISDINKIYTPTVRNYGKSRKCEVFVKGNDVSIPMINCMYADWNESSVSPINKKNSIVLKKSRFGIYQSEFLCMSGSCIDINRW